VLVDVRHTEGDDLTALLAGGRPSHMGGITLLGGDPETQGSVTLQ